jgi:hypothetical protein
MHAFSSKVVNNLDTAKNVGFIFDKTPTMITMKFIDNELQLYKLTSSNTGAVQKARQAQSNVLSSNS